MSSLIMVVPSFSVNMERLKDGSTITNFGNIQVCFSKLLGFYSEEGWTIDYCY